MKDIPTREKILRNKLRETRKMYATNYTYVSTHMVYQMPHTEPLTVEPLIRLVEAILEGNNCIAIFVMNQAMDRWWMLPVGLSYQTLDKNNSDWCTKYTNASS
jgi:hypothetical protein